jgi:hypothetical protein
MPPQKDLCRALEQMEPQCALPLTVQRTRLLGPSAAFYVSPSRADPKVILDARGWRSGSLAAREQNSLIARLALTSAILYNPAN